MSTTKTFSKESFPTEFTKNNYILMIKENDSMKYPLSEKKNENSYAADSESYLAAKEKKFKEISKINKQNKKR